MREIKFRAWDKRTKELVGVSDISWMKIAADNSYKNSEFYHLTGSEKGRHYKAPQDQVILMQFTGLLDKNGVEIYEGDIIKSHTGWKDQVVAWDDYRAGFYAQLPQGSDLAEIMNSENRFEIIGNIYENKELLNAPR